MSKYLCLFAVFLLLSSPSFSATQKDLRGPPGSGEFGTSVTVLPNGNFVVTDPFFDQASPPVADVGAVYLYNPEGLLISALFGSNAFDQIGNGGVTVLANGNFVVISLYWSTNRGAVTWGSAVSGFIGGANITLSTANSLTGSTTGDRVGSNGITILTNGNYVVSSIFWNNTAPPADDAGAVTWGNGFIGTTGEVSTANSLVGTSINDNIGSTGVTALTNGNYVVGSLQWDNTDRAAEDAGAVTWGNGFTGTAGPVSTANSLTGSSDFDFVSNVIALTNGNYVVNCGTWDNTDPAAEDAGAVTWGNGFTGTTGPVSTANSLTGSSDFDFLGLDSVTALTNGNYVVRSPGWDDGSNADLGAVTWCNGRIGTTGSVSTANSLTGSSPGDEVGSAGVIALTSGHYVVRSPNWNNSAAAAAGAVTWGNGFTGTTGPVSPANSLVGSTDFDQVGNNSVIALTNGHYVVSSPNWDTTAAADAGAVTWGNGFTGGTNGLVSPANSLVGSTDFDQVGNNGIFPLTNGHYVVSSPVWDNTSPAAVNAGAATWGSGTKGVKGRVSNANSLTGSSPNDSVGYNGVTALTNGHYVVSSPEWDNGATSDAGAATWGNGFTGIKGPISTINSLTGSSPSDLVSLSGVTPLSNGNYVVTSQSWNRISPPQSNAGAATWGNGTTGISGSITPANSLVGFHSINSLRLATALKNGHYVVSSLTWDNTPPFPTHAECVSLSNGDTGTTGHITKANSVLGTLSSGVNNLFFSYDPTRNQLIVSQPNINLVTLFRGDRFRSSGINGQPAPGAADIAYSKPGTSTVSPDGSTLSDFTLTGYGSSKGKNRALFSLTPATGLDLVLQSGSTISTLSGDLPFNVTVTALFGQLFNQPHLGLFQATVKGTGINSTNNRLLLLDNGASVQLLHRTGTLIPSMSNASVASFKEVLQSHDQDAIAVLYQLKLGNGVTPTNDEGLLFLNHSGVVAANLAAREGLPAFGGGGSFGPFTIHAALSMGNVIHFSAQFKPANGKPVPAVFTSTLDGATTARLAAGGNPAPGGGTFNSFTALSQQGINAIVKATLKASPASQNEGLFLFPANVLLTRKGEDIGGGTIIARILKFWPAGPGQIILQVQIGKGQALLLRQNDSTYLTLLRTGFPAPGVHPARLATISAVDVNPVSGRYAVLGTLSGSPSNSNQALWTGDPTLGDNTTLQALRLPQLTLRKGNHYSTDATPYSLIRSIALKPAEDPTGAGGRGLAQALGASDDLALFLTGDRGQVEAVLLDR